MSGKLKEVRERIKSVTSTQQITKAMKMVSAAKLRRAQDAILRMRPYSDRLVKILKNILLMTTGESETMYGVQRNIDKAMIVVITSNRGLCGAFNSNVIKSAIQAINDNYTEQRKQGTLSILCIGKRGYEYFRKNYSDCEINGEFVELFKDLSYENVSQASTFIMDKFREKSIDSVKVSYGRFKNAGVQYPETVQYLPVEKTDRKVSYKKLHLADYLFEPGKEKLLKILVPSILQAKFHRYILDTHASEHGARMTAMDKATDNANEMLKELRINYNKARQEAITRELSEIVGGAAALEG